MNTQPLVSLITVNFNTTADTLEFLESVQKLSYPHVEVIVIDNASKENPAEEITRKFPDITFLRSEENLGFAGGNNLGVKEAKGKYLFFLNNDTVLYQDFIEPIVSFMETHPEVGMATPKILFGDEKTIQYVGSKAISPYTAKGLRLHAGVQDTGQFDKAYETDLGHGAALIVPRKVIDEVGHMPEVYFLYYEEHDWCQRVKDAGYKIYFIGLSKIVHKQSMSTGEGSPLKTYYLTRNRILFVRRNFSGLPRLVGILYFTIVTVPGNILRFALKRKTKQLKAFLQGIFWHFKYRPEASVKNDVRM